LERAVAMKVEYYYSVANMLNLQLKEEEAHYKEALVKNGGFRELGKIERRIASLQASLFSLNNRIRDLNSTPAELSHF
jgi:hypothetical protein